MQVDRMCRAEAAITVKQNKKQRGGTYPMKGCKDSDSFKSSTINGRANGGKKKEKLLTCRWRKEKKDEHLKYINYAQ